MEYPNCQVSVILGYCFGSFVDANFGVVSRFPPFFSSGNYEHFSCLVLLCFKEDASQVGKRSTEKKIKSRKKTSGMPLRFQCFSYCISYM
jgi:hypothetical protein